MRVYVATFALCAIAALLTSEPCCGSEQYQESSATNWQSPAPSVGTEKNQSEATNKAEAPAKRPPSWCTAFQKSEWWLVVIAALTGLAIAYQAREMTRAANVMQGQMNAMLLQLGEMSMQTTLLKEYVGHTETTAVAAKESADAARDSVETFISKERARLRIIVQPFEPGFSPVTAFVKYRVRFHGNADAFVSQSAAYAVITASDVPSIDDERASIFRIALPDVIDRSTDLSQMHMVHAYSEGLGHSFQSIMAAVDEARAFVHFYAFIKYRTLDTDRETRVCLTWNVNPALNAMLGTRVDRWEKTGPEESNRET